MVFETLVADLLNRYLGSYLEKVNASQLRLGLLSGNVVLENVDVRATAFDDLSLPIRVLRGHISRFALKIPFKNLYNEPVVAELDGLHILAVPNSEIEYDESKERQYRRELKQKTLDLIEEAKLEHKSSVSDKDSFLEKLAAQIIKNVQVKIENIHIRYEDHETIPGYKFATGLTLKKLAFQTCDEKRNPMLITDDKIREFLKLVELDSFTIYWNHNTKSYSELTRGPLNNIMNSTISSADNFSTGFDYILRPISYNALLHFHMQPEKIQFSLPRISLDIDFYEIDICLRRNQYSGVVLFLESIDRMILQNKFRKYKALIGFKRTNKCWWKYAYYVVIEEVVRRRSKMSWKYIQSHIRMVRAYTELWTKKISKETLKSEELLKIEYYEDELDILNITLARQQAEIKAPKKKRLRLSTKKKKDTAGESGKRSWIGSWFGSSSKSSSTSIGTSGETGGVELLNRFHQEMTPSEKAKLYSAIDYSETGVISSSGYPADYVSMIVNFSLSGLIVSLENNDLKDPRILKMQTDALQANIQQRSGDNAFDFTLLLLGIEALGAKHAVTGLVPTLVTSHSNIQSEPGSSSASSLLSVKFSKNPLDKLADQRLRVSTDPIEFIYDADTINKIVDFFKPPGNVHLDEISSTVLPSIEEMKTITATGLRHIASKRSFLDVRIDIQPSCFLLPELGIYKEKCRLILVDFGSVSLRSKPAEISIPRMESSLEFRTNELPDQKEVGFDSDDDTSSIASTRVSGRAKSDERYRQLANVGLEQLKEQAYDHFQINLTNTQIVMVSQGQDWRAVRNQADSVDHILKPLGLNLTLRRCIISLDFGLPQFQLDGYLPLLGIDLTDSVLESMLDVIAHIPVPEADPNLLVPVNADNLLKDVEFFSCESSVDGPLLAMKAMRTARELQASDNANQELWFDSQDSIQSTSSSATPIRTVKPVANLVILESTFLLQEICLRIFQNDLNQVVQENQLPLLQFNLNEVGMNMYIRKWDNEIRAHLRSIKICAPRFLDPVSRNVVCLVETAEQPREEHLFSVRLLVADKVAPDFATQYANNRHHLVCEFRSIRISLHQEALVSVFSFLTSLAKVIGTDPVDKKQNNLLNSADTYEADWARRIGDEEGVQSTGARRGLRSLDERLATSQMTPVDAVTGLIARQSERRNIRIEAAAHAKALGQYVRIPEIDITQWKVLVTLGTLKVILCSSKSELMAFSMQGMRVDVSMTYLVTEVSVAVSDICISDLDPDTSFRQLFWIEPGTNIFLVQFVVYSQGTKLTQHIMDPNKVDIAVTLQTGKAHVVLLYWFLRRVLSYTNAFQSAIDYGMGMATEASNAAIQQVQQAVNNPVPTRVALCINLEAPVIYFPQNSRSKRALVFDLGSIHINNEFNVTPSPAPNANVDDLLMLDMMTIEIENLRMSAALLMDGGRSLQEKNVILPINMVVHMNRKVFPSSGDGVPNIDVSAELASINLHLTFGDYKLINEALMDNFAEGDAVMGPLETSAVNRSISKVPSCSPSSPYFDQTLMDQQDASIVVPEATSSVDKAVTFNFVLKKVDIELLGGINPDDKWTEPVNDSRKLGLFRCTEFGVKGYMYVNQSAEISVYLRDVLLTDTRPQNQGQITRILSQAESSKDDNVIQVAFQQDPNENKSLDITVCSLYVCASLDYFMQLVNFFVEGAPRSPIPPAQPVAPAIDIISCKTVVVKNLPRRKSTLKLKARVAEPEVVVVEDMSDPTCNAIVLTTGLNFDYNTLEEETVINASINGFKVIACPFDCTNRVGRSMEVIPPTSLYLYARQPLDSYFHGTVNLESLKINVNAVIIRSISKIINQFSSLTSVASTSLVVSEPSADGVGDALVGRKNFWTPKKVTSDDLPFIKNGLQQNASRTIQSSDDSSKTEKVGCDVANLLTEADKRREEKILVRIEYFCLSMETQIGAKQVPMLIMEANLEGEIVAPTSCLSASLTIELAMSYYNDQINEWEQLLETLPEEKNRLWSVQLEFTSCDQKDLFDKQDWKDISTLQSSGRTLSIVSRDNLEVTISKTALDVLSKLGGSFEDAYMSPTTEMKSRDSRDIEAAYVLQNQTGVKLSVIVDSRRLHPVSSVKRQSIELQPMAMSSGGSRDVHSTYQIAHTIDEYEIVGLSDTLIEKAPILRSLQTTQLVAPLSMHVMLASPQSRSITASQLIKEPVFNIHRTANFMFVASNPASLSEGGSTNACRIPMVASITAFLGQKKIALQSTLQLVNETPHSIKVYARRSPSGRNEPHLLTELQGNGKTYSVPVDVVTSTIITGLMINPANEMELSQSSDVIYWPKSACPLSQGSATLGEAAVYLNPISNTTNLITYDNLSSVHRSVTSSSLVNAATMWPVQNLVCISSSKKTSAYKYTVTVEPRFDGQENEVTFIQPVNGNVLSKQPQAYNLVIRTPASLHNLLPIPITFDVASLETQLDAGHTSVLCTVDSTGFSFFVTFNYDEKIYQGEVQVNEKTDELTLIEFQAQDGYALVTLNLGLRCSRRRGHIDVTIYSPYWMVNKTGLSLAYKSPPKWAFTKPASRWARSAKVLPKKIYHADIEMQHPAKFPGVLFFSVISKSTFVEQKSAHETRSCLPSSEDEDEKKIFRSSSRKRLKTNRNKSCNQKLRNQHLSSKAKVVLRVENSTWSSKFSLDTVGSWGRLHCEGTNGTSYDVGVKIDLSSSGLTKIVTFMPYFMIVNRAERTIQCAQVQAQADVRNATWISVAPGKAKPFWPSTVDSKKMLMVCRLGPDAVTLPFPLYESHSILLKLENGNVGVFVEVQTTDEATVINLQTYKEGMALVHIINNFDDIQAINFYQKGTGVTHTLEPGKCVYYTWDDASKPRQFFFYFNDPRKVQQLDVTTDNYETISHKGIDVYTVSFLSNLQRTVIFTNSVITANAAARMGELESVNDDITVVLQSIGISLVDNHNCYEVCYISIRSSEVKWNRLKRDNRMKPLKPDASLELEIYYAAFLNCVRVGEPFPECITLSSAVKTKTTVDLNQMMMLEPEVCGLRRTFEPGIHLHYRASANQMHVHAKIFRLQVDSQHLDSTFPVVFAPYPQAASVDSDSRSKPLVEVFAIICRTGDEEVYRFKRLECLIQEMQCKLDQSFLNEMIDFFAATVPKPDELTGFDADKKLTCGDLLDAPVIKDILKPEKESIFDYLHISPIKMHVSFSLVGSSQEGRQTAFHSDVLNLFLQSLGVALTDVQDVIFKLGYFERRGCIMSMSKVTSEMTRHYAGQAIKQTYVLVLGLDVIGNPFGVIRGMAQGVEDLFYEPVKGAVLGTEEFAEGVALGVRSLVGHTVGGAAGAVSRITGTLGKGVAALTLDDDYKRKRREQMQRRPDNFGAGMAQGGKGLVMGVFDGVTGIVTQPIEGAKKDGVEGFFKGITKGLVGVIARPISGVVDFASSSFEGIRRVAAVSKEVVSVRPPRFIGLDGVIRPYDRQEAQGQILLKQFLEPNIVEEYVFHVPMKKSNSVCLLTSRRLMVLTLNEILGTWSCYWQTLLSELAGGPAEHPNGLEVRLLTAQKKIFGSSTSVKIIECNLEATRRMQGKIMNRLAMDVKRQ